MSSACQEITKTRGISTIRLKIIAYAFLVTAVSGCSDQESVQPSATNQDTEPFEQQLVQALSKIDLDRTAIILPKVPYPVSTPARMDLVTQSLHDPTTMVGVSRFLVGLDSQGSRQEYVSLFLGRLGIDLTNQNNAAPAARSMEDLVNQLEKYASDDLTIKDPPVAWRGDDRAAVVFRGLLGAAIDAHVAWNEARRNLTDEELQAARDAIGLVLKYKGEKADIYRLLDKAFNATGVKFDLGELASALTMVLAAIEHGMHALQQESLASLAGEWMTPLGRVEVAGKGDDVHSGEYLLLIDPGGNDTYREVAAPFKPGGVSIVLDRDGDDTVLWESSPGPGAGLLGISIWVDMAGNDRYMGNTLGLGAGLLGAGMFFDVQGNDTYETNAMAQGVGQYGIGILLDNSGDDDYSTGFSGQGYGGPGGVGVLLDHGGNDVYSCGNRITDMVAERINRHHEIRFLSLCQGFGFGVRPDISGGIGILLDSAGNDIYKADIFGQGAAYWFGLGMLVDKAGDDRYEVFEYGQGSGLHLAAGLLSDWAGNDQYTGYEHTQGAGKDRSAGLLFDREGDDFYTAKWKSQGAGFSSYGFGFLIELGGDDHYKALRNSQGYSEPDPEFPGDEWPAGILLDFSGQNIFELPFSDPVDMNGRIQNKQGIAIDYGQ